MIDMFDSPEAFTAYATIDAGYSMLKMEQDKLAQHLSKPPIIKAVDIASGYDNDFRLQISLNCETILTDIIEAKKVISAESKADEKMLSDIKNYINKIKR